MEEHQNNSENSRKSAGNKATKTVHLSEETSSSLVGGILEKGFSSDNSSNFKTPSFSTSSLPFPVARHRSLAPHRTPVVQFVANGGDGADTDGQHDDGDEENELTNSEALADFAKPIKMEKKKGLNFSKWKQAIHSDIDSNVQEKDNTKSMKEGMQRKKIREYVLTNIDVNSFGDDDLSSDIDKDDNSCSEEVSSSDMVSTGKKEPSSTCGPISLEGQIDAENRVLLEKMSPDEIAEAQAEIRNRLNPELLNILKKRSMKKLEKKDVFGSTPNGVNVMGDKEAGGIEENMSLPEIQIMPVLEKKSDEGAVKNSVQEVSKLWSSWSKRVEAVRNLRFSIDGNVVEGKSLSPTFTADNVAERDFLRSEGDPAAGGYTVKEALSLARSVVPGQRTLAWHLLASVLNRALHNICRSELDYMTRLSDEINLVDWEAVWAYALGPEPELALSLRLAMDDNHQSVTLASAKVIRSILTCDLNEEFFNVTVKLGRMDLYRAPVFRSRPDIKHGFLGGGFWKYSTKPSNIIPSDNEVVSEKNQGERTIQDDNVVASQDVAAGLVRMELLPRLRYLLETEPAEALEECILSILVALARHSPTCAKAIWKFERLLQTIVDRFNKNGTSEVLGAKIKSVMLLRVLAQSSKTTCIDFINKGFFQAMLWQLYRVTPITEWVKFGSEKSKLASQLMVEQLRFWKVSIMYGHCISSFAVFFPALCIWLNPPTFDKLTKTNFFNEFSSITTEIYLVLDALANTLPDPYSSSITKQQFWDNCGSEVETWCWNDVSPMVDSALLWLELKPDSTLMTYFDPLVDHHTNPSSLLWILSAIMRFLCTVLIKTTPTATKEKIIPSFVTKLALRIVKNGIFYGISSFVDKLCYFRRQSNPEASLVATRCLTTLLCLVVSSDKLIFQTGYELFEGNMFFKGIFKSSLPQWENVLGELMNIFTSEWRGMSQIEVFGRGGPSPGVGVGWGALGGGFWSLNNVALQEDARLSIELLGSLVSFRSIDLNQDEDFTVMVIKSALALSLMVGPGDKIVLQKIFDILLKLPVLKYLNQCISCFLGCEESVKWEYKDNELIQFSEILSSHFTKRWLDVKRKKNEIDLKSKTDNKVGNSLASIPEDVEESNIITREDINSLTVEWARQRMPLPNYWLLSPITTISQDSVEFLKVAKAGLFLLLGIEAMFSTLSDKDMSIVRNIPLIWKLHSISVPLLIGKHILEDERSRDMFEALQSLYGQHLDELEFSKDGGCLRFQTEIHENYSTFFDALVEQFSSVSYGDLIFGRQIGIYLHRQVESSVRLAAWISLSNSRVLELLPPLDQCMSQAEGYLEPVEDNAAILEAYVNSWVSGALDRAATRESMPYMIVIRHLSSFIFSNCGAEMLLLRNKLVKSLLRDYSRKKEHEAMMLDLTRCNHSANIPKSKQTIIAPRLEMLKEACEGNFQLFTEVDKLKSSIRYNQIGITN